MNKINQKNHIEDIVMEIDDAQVRTIQIIHTMVKQIDQLEKRFKESSKNNLICCHIDLIIPFIPVP